MLAAAAKPVIDLAGPRGWRLPENAVRVAASTMLLAAVFVIIILPLYALLSQAFEDGERAFVGLANFVEYAKSPSLRQSVLNSALVGGIATAIVVPLAFLYAYALTRSCLPLKGLFRAIGLLPIFAPSLLPAIALVYIFGNQGYLKSWMFGHKIYGPIGIVIAQVFHCFPYAMLILSSALANADARLYEVAETLETTSRRAFWTITFPSARYGIVNAAFVVFTTAIVDFGIAKVIGGQYNVLAIDVYRQIIGQQNFQMGAVIGVVLLLPSILTFLVERAVARRQVSQISSRSTRLQPKRNASFDIACLAITSTIALPILMIVGTAIFASLVKLWPYDLSFSFGNYNFADFDPDGWTSYWNSVTLAAWTAFAGTVVTFAGAYLMEKARHPSRIMSVFHGIVMVPLAVPGIVLGLGYVFFFNAPLNPLSVLYGTMSLMVLCTIAHYYTVPHLMALTALKQLDREVEAASDALGVPFWITLFRVTIPISLPAIIDIATYFFVNAMTTVAGIIFIYSAVTKTASVAVVTLDDTGDEGAACAMAMMILYTALGMKLLQLAVLRVLDVRRARTHRRLDV